ncbi:MAG: hypothetical protein ACQKBW_06875, partial [Puniceicoccales bacterium]
MRYTNEILRLIPKPALSLKSACLFSLLPAALSAQTIVWDSATEGGLWSDGPNWVDGSAPGAGETAVLGDAAADRTVTYDASASGTVGGLTMTQTSAFANTVEVQRTLELTDELVLGSSTGTTVVNLNTSTESGITTGSVLTASSGVTLNSGGVLEFNRLLVDTDAVSSTQQLVGDLTISGGTLNVYSATRSGTTTRNTFTNTIDGSLSMTSGTILLKTTPDSSDTVLTDT